MHLGFHIGQCCGIKTIFGFYGAPDSRTHETLKEIAPQSLDKTGSPVKTQDRLFHESAPNTDTYLERLDRYLEFVKKHRPSGVVEAVLAAGPHFDQKTQWGEILEARGFRIVTEAYNSNSKNTIYIYHLVTREGKAVHYFKNGKEKKGKS